MSNPAQHLMADLDQMHRKLDAAIENAFTKASEVKHSNAELWEKVAKEADELTDYQIEMMRAEILAHERTPEWQRVIDRIAADELTWRQVVVSYYTRKMDPDVRLAFDSLRKVPSLTPEQLRMIAADVRKQFEPADAEETGPVAAPERSPRKRQVKPDPWATATRSEHEPQRHTPATSGETQAEPQGGRQRRRIIQW